MRSKFKWIFTLLLALTMQFSFAQEKTITGVVTDASGPLPGVNVVVKGTQRGVSSGFDGKYSIKAKEGETIVFSFMGMREVSKVVGASNVINTVMQSDAKQIGEVVVTAFNIKRNPKKLGYAVSSIKADDVKEGAEPDLTKALNGKVAGVNINVSSGVAGSSNQITIRGVNTFSGNVQPLIIVDGISYNNDQVTTSSQVTGGGGYQSGLSSLDPNDIATITVLKSAAAAALYGSRAVNGVIVITTKSGSAGKKSGKTTVNVSSGTYFENIANLPEYQNTYGAGSNFSYSGSSNGSWGPKFGTLTTVPTWAPILSAFPEVGSTVPYVAQPDNVKSLFKTGLVSDNSVGFNYAGNEGTFNLTMSKLNQDGYIPNNEFNRSSVSVGGSFKVNDKMTFGGNLSVSKTFQSGGFFGENQFNGASSGFARALFLARNWDMSLPYEHPVTGASVSPLTGQFDHPLWSWKHDRILTDTYRTVAGVNFDYKFNSNLTATYRLGVNRYSLDRDEIRDKNSRAANGLGRLVRNNFVNEDLESTLLLTYNKKITEDLSFTGVLGNNILQNSSSDKIVTGTEFVMPNIYTFGNTKTLANTFEGRTMKRNFGLFADLSLSFKDAYFLNGTIRNDISSSLPKNNNSYLYYSLSGSLILTEALKINNDYLNFLKLRGGFARVGRDADSEFLNIAYDLAGTTYNGSPIITNKDRIADRRITPEFTNEIELGLDAEFFNKRMVLDFTAYKKNTTNVITPVNVPGSTGFAKYNTNVGELENRGLEIGLTLIPLKTDNFKWTSVTTFTKNENRVLEIAPGVDKFNLVVNTPSYAIVGQPFGVFYGTKFARDANGNYLINPTGGGIIQDLDSGIIGNPTPDFKMSFTNTFSYKGISLRGQFDWKKGGDISSTTIQSLLGRGVTKDTEDREKTVIIQGYLGDVNTGLPIKDANGNQIANNIPISVNDLYFSPGTNNNTFAINSVNEASIYDGTVFRLREISLGYDFSDKLLKKTPFKSINLSLIGNNLWYFAPNVPKYTNFDPDVTSLGTSNAQGIEVSTAPTSKRYGFKINLTF
ncbi:Vitamin B12 transporter BtuB [Flavobacterium columnare]|uniref:SusC/RagA family TonB-linked outer membrane protein n=2 Tax=Flavobacterium TaxID=237 RepID=A0ABW8PL15_9FLAO|nr:SusC/RagA family TonB-linked outer membrane protein [Flavobacterium columnare]SPE76433.1 Vitamin B12 transporter BtuB [Flavobacterium columnare]